MLKSRRILTLVHRSLMALFLSTFCLPGTAQVAHANMAGMDHSGITPDARGQAGALLQVVRNATERFKDPSAAVGEGYAPQFGCVSGPDFGAMGLHYVNGALVNSGVLDVEHPQIVIYEPTPGGKLKLIGADYLLIASAWDAHHSGPPQLMGQLFQYFESPNRFGLPAFYTLHVWAWKQNPNGAFVNWHPNVSCQSFSSE